MTEKRYSFPKFPKPEPTFGHKVGEPIREQEHPSGHTSFFLSVENWDKFKSELTALVVDCFPEHQFTPQEVEQMFEKQYSNDLVALLQDKEKKSLIGFSVAHIYTQHPDTAVIEMTGVAIEKRGEKLVGELLSALEEELKQKGVEFLTRNAKVENGYADAIERHYGDRVVEIRDSESGEASAKRYFKIKL